jgi:hypothetical protein
MHSLIIGHVWPEPDSSAAGQRMHELICMLHAAGWTIAFATTAQVSEFSKLPEGIPVACSQIELNNSSFDTWVKALKPDLVIFDRFMTEEQFGWRIAQNVPQALRVLDTEDLHFLRQHRENTLGKDLKNTGNQFHTPLAFREIAAIYRCDLSLIISEFEMQLLQTQFNVPSELLHYLPFCRKRIETEDVSTFADFEQRECCGQYGLEPDETCVAHNHVDLFGDFGRTQAPRIGLLEHDDARIGAQLPRQLHVTAPAVCRLQQLPWLPVRAPQLQFAQSPLASQRPSQCDTSQSRSALFQCQASSTPARALAWLRLPQIAACAPVQGGQAVLSPAVLV